MTLPSSVLLEREVYFEYDSDSGSGEIERIPPAIGVPPSPQDIKDAILTYLQIQTPDAHFENLPKLSYIRFLRPTNFIPWLCGDITDAFIASADKDLVALYAGPYRPGTNLKGAYLIYETSSNSLSTIPQPPNVDGERLYVGLGAVVVCLEDGAYVLGELTKVRGSAHSQAALYTWQLSTKEWVLKVASFPPELCPPNHVFEADMCFSYRGASSVLCWVDLFKGMLVCDLRQALHPVAQLEFRFVPLPKECPTYDRGISIEESLEAGMYRSIACVGDSIKLVTMDGYCERPANELRLTIWTLSPDLCDWSKGSEYLVSDIWASETHISLGLPKILPSFPVLSMDGDDVVYLFFTDMTMSVNGQLDYKGQYLLRVDMRHNKVSHHPQSGDPICSQLFATDCSAYLLQGLKGNQGKVKARKVGERGKRVLL
uniref:Uncharacterized protein n=1 Tax=Avena sativa TaxID=4498 RepID=A0ACD5VZD7_AVESA